MKARIVITLIAVFLGLNIIAESSQNFAWPGIDGKFLNLDHLSRPGQMLSDSIHAFDALHYKLDLNTVASDAYFSASMTLQFRVVNDSLSEIRLNMVGLAADSAFVGTTQTSYSRDDTSIVVSLGGMHFSPETLAVTICYHDTIPNRGFYYFPQNSYTMSEPQDARWWFPCYDEPWDKATSEIYVKVPEGFKVGSNGYLAGVVTDSLDETQTYHWVNNYPIATYLISLIMGDYATWNDYYVRSDGDSVPIFYMVAHGDSAAAAYDFATIPAMMTLYSNLYGPYPFNKYGQGAVVPFNSGAMENQTMTTINRFWITGNRGYEFGYAHELAHMWWGDKVTLADWRNIWLNEGFATYSSAVYNGAQYSHDAFIANIIGYRDAYFDYDQNARREPIYAPTDLFGLHVYNKGAWVLHMLRGIIGDTVFFSGMRLYGGIFAYGNASTQEFKNVMENVSGQDLGWFFNEWVFDQGYPIYDYAWSYQTSGDSFLVRLDIAQVQTNAPVFRMPMTVRIVAGGNHDFSIQNYQTLQEYEFAVTSQPETLIIDPDLWILKKTQQVAEIETPGGNLLPVKVDIDNIYPNPFNSSTTISFSVDGRAQEIELKIFDIQGRLVRSLESGRFEPNSYSVSWDGRDNIGHETASGVYLVSLTGPHQALTRKITYIR